MKEEQKTFFSDCGFSCFKMLSSFLVFTDEYTKRHLVVHVFHTYALGMVQEYPCLDRPSVGGKHDGDTM